MNNQTFLNHGLPGFTRIRSLILLFLVLLLVSARANENVVVINPGSKPVPMQGTAADNAAATGNPVQTGGKAVTGSSYAPAYTTGDAAVLAIDKDSGGVLAHIRKLTRVNDAVSADPQQYTTVSTATPATTDATVFTLAAGEKGVIQNLSANAPLAYKLGASASTSSFNGVLKCGAAADDGNGERITIADYVGVVSVAKISGTARYIAYKLSP